MLSRDHFVLHFDDSSLLNRQKQWAKDEEERKRNIPDPDLPPGHRIMPKPEQQETLKKLKDCKCFLCYVLVALSQERS